MRYTKPPLTFEEQADQLLERGLVAEREQLIARLSEVNYYRLSGYWYPFRKPDEDSFRPGTSLELIWDRYVFDRQLRVLVMDGIERVEVAVRTALANRLSLRHGAFGHLDRRHLPNISVPRHRRMLKKIQDEEDRSNEVFVAHYHTKYSSETNLPLWMAAELMAFGTMLTLFRGAESEVKRDIAARYGIADSVLNSWLLSLNTVRNACAHHARLWNRSLGTPVMIPRGRKHPEWHAPVNIGAQPRRMFAVLSALRYLVRHIAPQSGWPERLLYLLEEKHPNIPIAQMGFPPNWKDSPIWKEQA
jgi:abortive infection bacteriophage resistance protein